MLIKQYNNFHSFFALLNVETLKFSSKLTVLTPNSPFRRQIHRFDVKLTVCVLVFSAGAIFLASMHGRKMFTLYIEDILFKEKQFVVNFGTWTLNQNAL